MEGMIHLYCGDGKGKTTCAFGLALRQAGRGGRVVIAQFLKTGDSGERLALARMPEVTLLAVPRQMKFTFCMDEAEKAQAGRVCAALLAEAEHSVAAGTCDLVVLDEVCGAISAGLLSEERLLAFLDGCTATEVVLTGRAPSPALMERADYITEMKKIRHPYDKGIQARKGIEW